MIKQMYAFAISKLMQVKFKERHVIFGKNVLINRDCYFEGFNKLYYNSKLKNVHVGTATYIGPNSDIKDMIIGKFCSIGSNFSTAYGIHPTNKFVSSHPAFYSIRKQAGFSFTDEQYFDEIKTIDKNYRVVIGNDVWIGKNVVVMEGVKIGNGVIIGTGSLVTKDVEPFEIIGGVPAKLIKKRFSEKQIETLEEKQWWNMDMQYLRRNLSLFLDIDLFCKSSLV